MSDDPKLRYLPVTHSDYGELMHIFSPSGTLVGLSTVSILGLYLDEQSRVVGTHTLRGVAPASLPIMGPCGEVFAEGLMFVNGDAYFNYIKGRLH